VRWGAVIATSTQRPCADERADANVGGSFGIGHAGTVGVVENFHWLLVLELVETVCPTFAKID